MSIIRTKKTKNYSVICNNFFSDTRLSWKAKGLLGYLLTKPDDWEVYVNQLATVSEDGRDSTTAGVNELLELGYIKRKQIREKGRFKYEYELA
jgi:predicted transcriptional regulator